MPRALPTAAALLLALAGCGGTPTGSDEASGTGTPPPPGATTPFPGITSYTALDPDQPANYVNPELPAFYLQPAVRALDNTATPATDRIAVLGQVLFHDPRLSLNRTVACASCHRQVTGFTDRARFSEGFAGEKTTAHAMRLANARWYAGRGFFWDLRAATLEVQALAPITNSAEMGFDPLHGGTAALFARMDSLPYYAELFTLAFGDAAVNNDRVARAIAAYVRAIVSTGSRWDAGYALTYDPGLPDHGLGRPLPNFTAEENRGRELFLQPPQAGGAGCAGCHVPPTFSLAANSGSNGLDAGEVTIFKSPSLKNVAVAGPYMHDGRFATLAEVVDHYADGVQAGPALDQRLRGPGGAPIRLALSAADRQALVAFLATLTDPGLLADPRFADPFIR